MPRCPFLRNLLAAVAVSVLSASAAWVDDFATLDTDRWLIQLYTFPANGCNMRAENVEARDSILRIHVTRAIDTTDRPYDGGDMGDQQYRTYGLFRTRMKPSKLKGSVSAFYLMNKWKPSNWEHQEIDIEFLGKNPSKVQLTTHHFQNGGQDWKNDSKTISLGFDYSEGFHEYAILWRPDTVLWFVDGRLLHKTGLYVPQVSLETRMNFYVGNQLEDGVLQWLGPIDTTGIPAVTEYDWVRFDPLDSLPPQYRAWGATGVTRRSTRTVSGPVPGRGRFDAGGRAVRKPLGVVPGVSPDVCPRFP